MIPQAHIIEWQHTAPWVSDEQIEQDLILCRILVELYKNEFLSEQLLFRGGTALNKLYFPSPVRYSEDLDFVQNQAGPIKNIVKTIQGIIDPWLGKSSTQTRRNGFRIYYSFIPESDPSGLKRVKIEINTREHLTVFPLLEKEFQVISQWYKGDCLINTYNLNELLGTKLRALYQRKKGRDLFDLDWAIRNCDVNNNEIVETFQKYLTSQGNKVTSKQFLLNLEEKMKDYSFVHDIDLLKRVDINFDPKSAYKKVIQLIKII